MHVLKSTLVLVVLILLSFHLSNAQGLNKYMVPYLKAAPVFESPEKELELLPDTPSYHVIQEIYNADTLTYTGKQLAFQNNGKDRYSTSIDRSHTQIIHLEKMSTSFSVQTAEDLDRPNGYRDTTQVWWKKGLISKATVLRYGFRREIIYEYDKGKLVHKAVDYGDADIRETNFFYHGEQLVKMVYVDRDSRTETSFSYTDSLITSTTVSDKDSSQYLIQGFSRLDDKGRVSSLKTFMKRPKESEPSLYQSEEYSYTPDGYQVIYTMYLSDGPHVSKKEIHHGIPAIEKWTWPGEDQVLILRSYPD